MRLARIVIAHKLAAQIIETCSPYLTKPIREWDVLDCGAGYGATTMELAKHCRLVKGIEPSRALYEFAIRSAAEAGVNNVSFECISACDLEERNAFDLVVLDNVLEHIPDHLLALTRLYHALRPRGILFLIVPNRLWPIEVHYRLPFLSYLPLWLANAYLRITGCGSDYSDACYAPTYWGLKRILHRCGFREHYFVVPANLGNTMKGAVWYYRAGAWLLRHAPVLWAISKAFVVVARKCE